MSYKDRTKEELEDELKLRDKLAEERAISNTMYARILTEKIVFIMAGTILLGFLNVVVRYFIVK